MAPLLIASAQSLLMASLAMLSLAIPSFFCSCPIARPAASITHAENNVATILFMVHFFLE
jgi:hypothetical protein